MRTLQDYILESIENDEINEGKIWNAIKKWWNDLFEPTDKKYDRYASKMDNVTQQEYKEKIKNTFKTNNITIKQIDPKSLNTIIKPNGEEPNKETNTGFWKFTNERVVTANADTKFYAFIYEDSDIKDTIALLKVDTSNNGFLEKYVEILNLQIIDYFYNVFSIDKMIKFIKDNSVKLFADKTGIFIKKKTDKELYEKLINDCEFEKTTINNTINVAKTNFK